jgi:Tol biopolymer transport system component/DNA-binding winged helix-turn-helix (wHTH) protein
MMPPQLESVSKVGFGLYEADLHSGELWKAGRKVKLQGQPFKVLTVLLERPGEVVTREELRVRLWGKDAVGDFDHSLGTAINKIREALSDTADNPRFVETLARRGYRFIAPVTVLAPVVEAVADTQAAAVPAPESVPPEFVSARVALERPREIVVERPVRRGPAALVGVVVLLLAGAAGFFWGSQRGRTIPRIERITQSGRISPGMQAMESLPAFVTDGLRLFIPVIFGGRAEMAQVDAHTGAVQHLDVPSEIAAPTLGDLSPDGASLLLRSHLSPESEQPLWTVPTAGGSALRLSNVVAHDATWMPDGKSVLYAAGNQLLVNRLEDGSSRLFATLPGRAFWLRWSPDGDLLRFTLMDPVGHTLSLWQIGRDGKGAKPILTGGGGTPSRCCGVWSGDGKYFVFQASQGDGADLWRLSGKSTSGPARITNGPLSFEAPAMARSGHRIYFLGLETQSSLLQFDAAKHVFLPVPEFLAGASRVEYSRDRQWVLWTDIKGRLWRARANGSETIQVTPNSMQVFLAQWSPDGTRLALMAREQGKAWQLYLIAPDGGTPQRLLSENRNAADPSWSADGQRIVFGRVTDIMGKEDGPRALEMLDLRTQRVSTMPGSDGLFSPRWSPDGRYIAALSLDQRKLVLFDTTTQTWRTIAEATAADPVWASDSKSIFFHASQAEGQPIYRASVADGKLAQIANLTSFTGGTPADSFFCGLTSENAPIVRSRTGTGDVYSLDLDER